MVKGLGYLALAAGAISTVRRRRRRRRRERDNAMMMMMMIKGIFARDGAPTHDDCSKQKQTPQVIELFSAFNDQCVCSRRGSRGDVCVLATRICST